MVWGGIALVLWVGIFVLYRWNKRLEEELGDIKRYQDWQKVRMSLWVVDKWIRVLQSCKDEHWEAYERYRALVFNYIRELMGSDYSAVLGEYLLQFDKDVVEEVADEAV
jgi:hypothetical protein